MSLTRRLLAALLARRSYELRPVASPPPAGPERRAFQAESREIIRRHRAQTLETVTALRRKYAKPVLGRVETWSLLERLAACVDPTDESLFGVSQQFHVLQVLAAMETDGVTDRDLLAAALIHDVDSIDPDQCAPLMNARDRDWAARYLRPFRRYDQGSKSPYRLPRKRLDDYRDLATAVVLPRTLVV